MGIFHDVVLCVPDLFRIDNPCKNSIPWLHSYMSLHSLSSVSQPRSFECKSLPKFFFQRFWFPFIYIMIASLYVYKWRLSRLSPPFSFNIQRLNPQALTVWSRPSDAGQLFKKNTQTAFLAHLGISFTPSGMPSWLPSTKYPLVANEGYWAPITSTINWCEEVCRWMPAHHPCERLIRCRTIMLLSTWRSWSTRWRTYSSSISLTEASGVAFSMAMIPFFLFPSLDTFSSAWAASSSMRPWNVRWNHEQHAHQKVWLWPFDCVGSTQIQCNSWTNWAWFTPLVWCGMPPSPIHDPVRSALPWALASDPWRSSSHSTITTFKIRHSTNAPMQSWPWLSWHVAYI